MRVWRPRFTAPKLFSSGGLLGAHMPPPARLFLDRVPPDRENRQILKYYLVTSLTLSVEHGEFFKNWYLLFLHF